jgi:hypothetical protein
MNMKSKLLLCLALVLSGVFFLRVDAQDVTTPQGFPNLLPAVTNVNFSVTHPIAVRLPTKLKIERTASMLFVSLDTNAFVSTNLLVGSNAVTVVLGNVFAWPIGEPRPTNSASGFQDTLGFNTGTLALSTNLDGLPLAGQSYNVEMDLTAFETDAPAGHPMIFPWSTNYEIIWQQTLREIVKP